MVAGKLKDFAGQQQKTTTRSQKTAEIAARKQTPLPLHPPPLPLPSSRTVFSRSFGVYFPRATAQVQPRPPDVTELIKVIEELRDREARLKTEILELKLVNESAVVLAKENARRYMDMERRVEALEIENERLRSEAVEMRRRSEEERREHEAKVKEMATLATKTTTDAIETTTTATKTTAFSRMDGFREGEEVSHSRRFQGLIDASVKSNLIRNLKKSAASTVTTKPAEVSSNRGDEEAEDNLCSTTSDKSQATRVSRQPLKSAFSTSSHSEAPTHEASRPQAARTLAPPPPPPPPSAAKSRVVADKVTRVPEVVEFYHWLMRRDSRREPGGAVEVAVVPQGSNSRDMIGEIENRSAYSLAVSD